MSILIKGMEMPKSCEECLDIGWHYVFDCRLDDAEDGARLPNCPLVPVPPHGDLISRETAKLYHSYLVDERTDIRVPAIPLSVLNVIPTIIPAEEGE